MSTHAISNPLLAILRALLMSLLLTNCAQYVSFKMEYREAPSMLLPSGARPTAIELLRLEANYPDCVAAGTDSVVCYMPYTREMYLLQAREHTVFSRLLISLPAADPLPYLGYVDTYLWDLAAQDDRAGNLLISWNYSRNNISSINLLRVNPRGEVKHDVVKAFKPFDPVFNLRAFVVEPDFVQFFYTNFSEHYFSLSDTGTIEKLWTLGWRAGKMVFDTQLSERGRRHTTYYDAFHQGRGQFDVAWTERSIGSFFGPRRKFRLGSLTNDGDKPRLRHLAEIAMNHWDDEGQIIFPIVVPNGADSIKAMAAIYGGTKGAAYRMIYSSGKAGEPTGLEGREIDDLAYDARTGLFRYVKGGVRLFARTSTPIKAAVHWTDFRGSEWVERLQAPRGSIFPKQGGSDCFYWLQPERDAFLLLRKCRQARNASP